MEQNSPLYDEIYKAVCAGFKAGLIAVGKASRELEEEFQKQSMTTSTSKHLYSVDSGVQEPKTGADVILGWEHNNKKYYLYLQFKMLYKSYEEYCKITGEKPDLDRWGDCRNYFFNAVYKSKASPYIYQLTGLQRSTWGEAGPYASKSKYPQANAGYILIPPRRYTDDTASISDLSVLPLYPFVEVLTGQTGGEPNEKAKLDDKVVETLESRKFNEIVGHIGPYQDLLKWVSPA